MKVRVYDKWHEPHPNDVSRFVHYDDFEELAEKYLKTQQVLKEIFELLEEHQPPWYLRRHYNLMKKVLD